MKIMDFGVARLTTASMTGTGNIVGTADYMSPEQVKGAKVDGRSDLFSVGCMLYELLTGRRPFHSENLMAIFYKITHEEPNFDLVPEGAEYDALLPDPPEVAGQGARGPPPDRLRVRDGAARVPEGVRHRRDRRARARGPARHGAAGGPDAGAVHRRARRRTVVTAESEAAARPTFEVGPTVIAPAPRPGKPGRAREQAAAPDDAGAAPTVIAPTVRAAQGPPAPHDADGPRPRRRSRPAPPSRSSRCGVLALAARCRRGDLHRLSRRDRGPTAADDDRGGAAAHGGARGHPAAAPTGAPPSVATPAAHRRPAADLRRAGRPERGDHEGRAGRVPAAATTTARCRRRSRRWPRIPPTPTRARLRRERAERPEGGGAVPARRGRAARGRLRAGEHGGGRRPRARAVGRARPRADRARSSARSRTRSSAAQQRRGAGAAGAGWPRS